MRQSFNVSGLNARNRRIFALGVHGGEGDTPLDLDALLAQAAGLADLTDADLPVLATNLRAAADTALTTAVESGDSALIDAALAQVEQVTAQLTAIETDLTARETAAAELQSRVDAARAALTVVADPDPEPEDDEPEVVAEVPAETIDPAEVPAAEVIEPEPEAIAASAPVVSRVAARRPSHTAPRTAAPEPDPRLRIVASANATGIVPGTVLIDGDHVHEDRIAQLFENAIRAAAGWKGGPMNMPLMSLGTSAEAVYGRERTLGWDERTNEARIDAITSPQALVASGGACAPTPVNYDLPILGDDGRPVRDGLARFGAERGGVRLLPAVTLSQVSAGVSAWTAANDIALNAPATKPCVAMTCPSATETLVDAIVHCMTIGNFRARFFPEQVAAWTRQMAVQTARFADSRMLTEIGSGSTNVVAGQIFGTTRDVLGVVVRAATEIRNRNRIARDTPMRFMAPQWLLDNMIVDLQRQSPGDGTLGADAAYVNSLFAAQNINTSWFLDGESGQIFGAQAAGDLIGWISTVVTYLFPEGSWLFLDGGTLDLGIVRDSTLNGTNDFQMFGETFENVAFHGVESLRIVIDICPSGITQAPASVDPCTTGS